MMKFIWVDFETGGVDETQHDITQVAMVVEIDGIIKDSLHMLVRPSSTLRVSAEALRVQGKTLDEVMAHPVSQEEAYKRVVEFCGKYVNRYDKTDKFIWGGQNPAFDKRFLSALFTRMGDKFFGSWFWYGSLDLATVFIFLQSVGLLPGTPNHKLETITRTLQVDPGTAHDAVSDIMATRSCYWKMVEMVKGGRDGADSNAGKDGNLAGHR